jgi:hypothetical protein
LSQARRDRAAASSPASVMSDSLPRGPDSSSHPPLFLALAVRRMGTRGASRSREHQPRPGQCASRSGEHLLPELVNKTRKPRQSGTSMSSPTTCPRTTAGPPGPGWRTIPESGTCSSPPAPAGSTSRRAGGASSARPPSLGSPSRDHPRSNRPPASQQPSSTPELSPGYREEPHRQPGSNDAAMCTSFEESSTRFRQFDHGISRRDRPNQIGGNRVCVGGQTSPRWLEMWRAAVAMASAAQRPRTS